MFTTTTRLISLVLCLLHIDHSATSDDEFGCKLHDDWLKAVTVHQNRLYLIIAKKRPKPIPPNADPFLTEDWVYSLPFAASHIDSTGRRVRMFYGLKRESSNWQKDNQLDSSVSWLKILQKAYLELQDAGIILMQLNLLRGAKPSTFFLDVIMSPANHQHEDKYSTHFMIKDGNEQKAIQFGIPQEEYLVLGDGQKGNTSGFVMWLGPRSGLNGSILSAGLLVQEKSDKLITPAIPFHGDKSEVTVNPHIRYYRLLVTKTFSSKPYQLVQLQAIEGYTPTPVGQQKHRHWKSQQFGFIFTGVMHIWDIYRERVYLFRPKLDGSLSCMYEVLLNDYVACNDAEWEMKDSALCAEEASHVDQSLWSRVIIVATAIAGLLVVANLICIGFCCRDRLRLKIKKEKRRSSGKDPEEGGRSYRNQKDGTSRKTPLKSAHSSASNQRTVRTPKTNATQPKSQTTTTKQRSKDTGATPTEILFPT